MDYSANNIQYIHSLGARKVVGYALSELEKTNHRINAVYADVGTRFEVPQRMTPDRCFQIGIAEQSLVNILGGMCHEGLIPFGIAYAPFITMRAADQIRMTVGEMGLGINLIGGSAGLVSGNLGSASMALDDISMMRAIPNVVIIAPADCLEIVKAIEWASSSCLPVYIRITGGTKIEPVYMKEYEFEAGKANVLIEKGEDIVLYGCGVQVRELMCVAELLENEGIGATVIDMHTIKPIDYQIIERYRHCTLAVTVEEHNVIGGLGSAVAECLSQTIGQPLIRIGVEDLYPAPDSYDMLLRRCNLKADQIVRKCVENYKIVRGIRK